MPRGGDTTGAVTGVDFSLLDVPRDRPVEDPDAFLRAAIAWHFGDDTGCAFWLGGEGFALRPAHRRHDLRRSPLIFRTCSVSSAMPLWRI